MTHKLETPEEAKAAYARFETNLMNVLENGTQGDRVEILGMLVFVMLSRLPNTEHKTDLLNAFVRFTMAAGMEAFISTVKDASEKHNLERSSAKLGHIFVISAEHALKLSHDASQKLNTIMEVLEGEQRGALRPEGEQVR